MSIEYPKLRNVEALAVPGQRGMVALRDPSGLSDKTVIVTQDVLFLLTLFDGKHSLRDIQVAYAKRFGDLLLTSRLQEIIQQLDASLLLEGERLEAHRRQAEAQFRAAPLRAAAHAGSAYPAQPDALRAQLDQYLRVAKVSGAPTPAGPVRGLVAPHIDFARGGACYGWAYCQLLGAKPAETYVILGTDHGASPSPFVATRKSFATPLGTATVDCELLDAIQSRYSLDLLAGELAHRGEHSVEFQVIWLQHVAGEVKILPILCGAFHRRDGEVVDPDIVPAVREFVRAVVEAARACGRRLCIVAGADLSHVGPRFGDPQPAVPGMLRIIEAQDRALLERAAAVDRSGFAQALLKDNDARHICGFPAIYTLLSLLESGTGTILKYDQAADLGTLSVVTFASLCYI